MKLHGNAATAAEKAGVTEITVSISHSDNQSIAIALAKTK